MLATLPKLADRTFILGFFLPALLFTCGALWIFADDPNVSLLIGKLLDKEPGDAVFLVLGVWVLGVILVTLNHPLYRFLEGYSWPISTFARSKTKYQQILAAGTTELNHLYNRWSHEGADFPRADI